MNDLEQYKELGYVHCRSFFPPEKIDEIRHQAKEIFLLQLLRRGLVDSPAVSETVFEQALYRLFQQEPQLIINCGKHIQHLVALHQLSLSPALLTKIQSLGLQFPVISTRPVLYFNTPHLAQKEVYYKLTAHQDWRSMQGSLDSIVAWVPLTDIDIALGALEIAPATHHTGLLPSALIDGYGKLAQDQFEHYEFLPVEIKKGDVLFFSTFLVHRSGNNVTDAIRWSCHFRYNNLYEETFVERGFPHPYIYKPQSELITPDFPAPAQVARVFS